MAHAPISAFGFTLVTDMIIMYLMDETLEGNTIDGNENILAKDVAKTFFSLVQRQNTQRIHLDKKKLIKLLKCFKADVVTLEVGQPNTPVVVKGTVGYPEAGLIQPIPGEAQTLTPNE